MVVSRTGALEIHNRPDGQILLGYLSVIPRKSFVFSCEVGSDSEIGWVKLRDPPAPVCAVEVAFLRPNRRSLIVPKAVRRRPDRGDCRPSPCNLLKTRQIQF